MRALILKVSAITLTLLSAGLAAGHVGAHLRDGAQLKPPVVQDVAGRLTLKPSVVPADVQPVTSTHAS